MYDIYHIIHIHHAFMHKLLSCKFNKRAVPIIQPPPPPKKKKKKKQKNFNQPHGA